MNKIDYNIGDTSHKYIILGYYMIAIIVQFALIESSFHSLTLYVAVTQFTYGKLRYCYVKS